MKIKIFILILASFLLAHNALAQKNNKKIVISGQVTDTLKRPVKGAMIFVDNNNTGKVTNNKGIYKVNVNPDADSITVVTFNNGTGSVAIKGRTTINFTFGPSVSGQNHETNKAGEQDVNIGYGNVKRKDLLTPVNTIDVKNSRYASYNDIYEVLKGTPGVSVNGKNIKIQGQSSLTLSQEPLFVVDGVPVQSIDDISPRDVKDISVLKGASAAIYGSRGANGVIIITLFGAQGKK
jgi:TonB-dependent starch-binding outer membrane protein SusC